MATNLARALLAFTSLVSLGVAQRTWLVDMTNSAGSDFTDLPPAVAAASPGDLIRVRPGTYTRFSTSKGVTIIGTGIAKIRLHGGRGGGGAVEVFDLPAGQTFVLQNAIVDVPIVGAGVTITRCQGSVHLENVDVEPGIYMYRSSVTIGGSRVVGHPAVRPYDSDVVITDSEVLGRDGTAGQQTVSGEPAIEGWGSRVAVSRSHIEGGSTADGAHQLGAFPAPAVDLLSSELLIYGDSSTRLVAGQSRGSTQMVIRGQGTRVRLHPTAQLVPYATTTAIDPGLQVSIEELPSLRALGDRLGGTARFDLFVPQSSSYLMLASGPSVPVPMGTLGVSWLDPATLVTVASGTGPWQFTIPVPAKPILRGKTLTWQALVFDGSAWSLSNPARYTHD